ncbi:hypothetical protein GCM10027098_22970 [Bowmanella dokdonensis]
MAGELAGDGNGTNLAGGSATWTHWELLGRYQSILAANYNRKLLQDAESVILAQNSVKDATR